MPRLVVVSEIKKIAKESGKRVGKTYVSYLNKRVSEMVQQHIRALGSHKTLNVADAAATSGINRG